MGDFRQRPIQRPQTYSGGNGTGWPTYVPGQDTLIRLGFNNQTGDNLALSSAYDGFCGPDYPVPASVLAQNGTTSGNGTSSGSGGSGNGTGTSGSSSTASASSSTTSATASPSVATVSGSGRSDVSVGLLVLGLAVIFAF